MSTVSERLGSAEEALQSAKDDIEDLRCFVAIYGEGRTQSFIAHGLRTDTAGMLWLAMMLTTTVADLVNLPLEPDEDEAVPEGATVQ